MPEPHVPSVLALVPEQNACALWRAAWPYNEVMRHGYRCWYQESADPSVPVLAEAYDVIVFHRMSWTDPAVGAQSVAALHRAGKRVWLESDDDMWLAREDQKSHAELGLDAIEATPKQNRDSTRLFDGAIVSTERLRTVIHTFAPDLPVEVVPNMIDLDYWYACLNQGWDRNLQHVTTIGWAGGDRRDRDFAVLAGAWRRVAAALPDVHFVVMGHQPPPLVNAVPEDRLHSIQWLPLQSDGSTPTYAFGLSEMDVVCCAVADTMFNAAKCVTGDTLVVTDRGAVPIERLGSARGADVFEPIDSVRVMTDVGWRDASEFYSGGEQEVVTVTTECGLQVSGTANHPVRNADGAWVQLGELSPGDDLGVRPLVPPDSHVRVPFNLWAVRQRQDESHKQASLPEVAITEAWGAVLGYLLGDGSIQKNMVRISCDPQDQDVVNHIRGVLDEIGLCSSSKVKRRDRQRRGVEDVSVCSARFNDFLSWIGAARSSVRGRWLRVPWVIFQSPKAVAREFLRALFEADATVTGTMVVFTTKDEGFARDVLLLLTAFGIKAKLGTSRNAEYGRDYYRVSLGRHAADVFEREIGFVGARKRGRLAEVTARPHSNAYRPMEWVDAVASVERSRAPVFDLTVPGPHEFWAGGFCCHNTPIKAWEAAASGAAVVGSSWLYGPVIQHGGDGFVADTVDEWERALIKLARSAKLRRRMQQRMLRKVRDTYSLAANWWRHPQAWARLWEASEVAEVLVPEGASV